MPLHYQHCLQHKHRTQPILATVKKVNFTPAKHDRNCIWRWRLYMEGRWVIWNSPADILILRAFTDTLFRYAFNLCLFGHLYSQNFHMTFLFLTTILSDWLQEHHHMKPWPGLELLSFFPTFSPWPCPSFHFILSPEQVPICFSVVNSFIPSLPELAAVPNPHHPQDPQLPTASSGSQQGTQALSNSAGEPPLRWHEQMWLTEMSQTWRWWVLPRRYPWHQQPVCGHY